MGAAASSSSSYPVPLKKYDVFISFRGEDTRSNFTSHLYNAFCRRSITTYIDYELPKGDEISQSLLQAIKDSSVSVVVFSENFASSKWCLDELTHILQCRKHQGQVVIPVFYKVDPSDVRKQNGTYKEAFTKHERDFIHNQHKVNQWKEALFETANLAGWDSQTSRDEYELIQNIVNDVLQKLNLKYPSALQGLVGIDENCESIELLLEKTPIIGIWGMGGIGKTTMAKAVFAKVSSQYESCCFLENFREQSEKHGLPYMRDKLLFELLKGKNLFDNTRKAVGSTFDMRRLRSKKVFIVLDDVNSSKQLEYLAQECNYLGPNSRVIITTRDKHLLMGKVNEVHEAKALNSQDSLKLFCFKAFHKDHPEIGYGQLSKRAIAYARGIPLALIVLGSFLHSKTIEEWDSALKKLIKTPHEGIQRVLKLSYDGLDDEESEIFLDIACFLKGEIKEHVVTLLDSFGFHASIGIRTLVDRALITIDDKVWMHDLIQKMGWEIVHQECIKEPGRRSRLWDPEEVYDVLKSNQGTNAIEGIILDMSQIRDIHLTANTFNKMTNLRFLKFYSPIYERSCYVNLPFGLESFSNKLRYFHWDKYPLASLPLGFCPEKLVELRMRGSCVKKLWDRVQDLVNLKRINLLGSRQLMELPDFSMARNLETVDLSFCDSLCSVHPSILSLHTLVYLSLFGCKELKSLQSETHLKSLQQLDVGSCPSLMEFSLSSEKLTSLNLSTEKIKISHLPVERFRKLRHLVLNGSTLMNLPVNDLCCLTSLETFTLKGFRQVIDEMELHKLFDALRSLSQLYLEGCNKLSKIPDNISALTFLEVLSLEGSSVESLPTSIEHLSKLTSIWLTNCERLRSILGLPPFIEVLLASECTSLETVFSSTTMPESQLCAFSFENCVKLDEDSLCYIMELTHFSMTAAICKYNSRYTTLCYPGSRVPQWFKNNQTAGASITVELSPAFDQLLGFAFCCVLPQFASRRGCYICCDYSKDDDKHKFSTGYYKEISLKDLNSDHVFLWYEPHQLENAQRSYDEGINLKLACEFSVRRYYGREYVTLDVLIKACGVYPIYASEYDNMVREMELKFKLGEKTKRHGEIDVQEQLPPTKKLRSFLIQPIPVRMELKLATESKKSDNID